VAEYDLAECDAILHLSDLHFRKGVANPIAGRADALVSAVHSLAPRFRVLLIVISGDVAFAGHEDEYEIAGRFAQAVLETCKRRIAAEAFHIVIAPGNHDCDFSSHDSVREQLLGNLPKSPDRAVIDACVRPQRNFQAFKAKWQSPAPATDTGIISIADLATHEIIVATINTAWTSRKAERQGQLHLPEEHVEEVLAPIRDAAADRLWLFVFHHPYGWLESENARRVRLMVESVADVVLTGHEHVPFGYHKLDRDGRAAEFVEGGVLQDHDSVASSFNVLLVHRKARKFAQVVITSERHDDPFTFNADVAWLDFARNRYRLQRQFEPSAEFMSTLEDVGANLTHPASASLRMSDIFVYPDLRETDITRLKPQPSRLVPMLPTALLLNRQRVLFVAPEGGGKTSLARRIWRDLREAGKTPILLDGADLKMGAVKVDAMVRSCVKGQYSSNSVEAYLQLEKTDRAVVIDNFHRAGRNRADRSKLLRALEDRFEFVCLLCADDLAWEEVVAYDPTEEHPVFEYAQVEVLPLGHLRRRDLIERWHNLTYQASTDVDEGEIRRRVKDSEQTITHMLGRNTIPSYPIFVLILLSQHSTMANTTANSAGSHGYLYEALITSALAKRARRPSDIDARYNYLAGLAYHFFQAGVSSSSEADLHPWHANYCRHFSIDLDLGPVIRELVETRLLAERDGQLVFAYPYVYYYFVARYFRDHLDETTVRDAVKVLLESLHREGSSNIILFLAYLSKDPFVLRSIIDNSRALALGANECDIVDDTKFLNALSVEHPLLALPSTTPDENQRDELRRRDEHDRETGDHEPADVLTGDSGNDSFVKEVKRVLAPIKTIQILGQVLRNFPGSLPGDRKRELVDEACGLGLRVLGRAMAGMSEQRGMMLDLLKRVIEEHHPEARAGQRLQVAAEAALFSLMERTVFGIVRIVSESMAMEELNPTFREVLGPAASPSRRLIGLSVKMDCSVGFPKDDVLRFYDECESSRLAQAVVRHLVWYQFYLFQHPMQVRQSVCSRLAITMDAQHVEGPGKRSKKEE
jgi:hypothetical protein